MSGIHRIRPEVGRDLSGVFRIKSILNQHHGDALEGITPCVFTIATTLFSMVVCLSNGLRRKLDMDANDTGRFCGRA